MTSPIKSGDLCEVINGALGNASPNIGLIVRVLSFTGEHSKYGRMWRCKSEYAEPLHVGTHSKHIPGTADFAQSWLKKIEPPTQTKRHETLDKVEA